MFRGFALLSYLLLGLAARSVSAQLALPVSPACVSSPFGVRNAAGPRADHFHTGVDLPAPAGTWVRATADGTEVQIHRRGAAGLEVEIRHSPHMVTRYDHLGSIAPTLKTGRRHVPRGEVLGRIGRTGITYGTHLHFELLLNGTRVDPAPVLGVKPC